MEVETTKLTTLGILGMIILPLGFIWASNTVQLYISELVGSHFYNYTFKLLKASTTTSNKNKTKK